MILLQKLKDWISELSTIQLHYVIFFKTNENFFFKPTALCSLWKSSPKHDYILVVLLHTISTCLISILPEYRGF